MRINYASDALQPKGCQKTPGNGLRVDVQPVEAYFCGAGCMLEPVRHSPCYARE
ncbi:MAG: hypothetical protein WBE46_08760 [Dehalococcoidia bacterium]